MTEKNDLDFALHSRRDFTVWLALVAGVGMAVASFSLAPGENCDEAGHCYPYFVWIGRALGSLLGLGALYALLQNATHGVRFLPDTQELVWWSDSKADSSFGSGRISMKSVARIEVDLTSDNTTVRLIDLDGKAVPGFTEALLPRRYEAWAKALVARCPHILLNIKAD